MSENNSKNNLEWGQTPWDDMPREELLLNLWRMYAALLSGYNTMSHQVVPSHVYWSKNGSGGATMESIRQALAVPGGHEQEDLYRSFFRMTKGLLFEHNGFVLSGSLWLICPNCGTMLGRDPDSILSMDKEEGCVDCGHVMRRFVWSDIRPDIAAFLESRNTES